MAAAAVALGNIGHLPHRARQQAAAERRIGNVGNAERARGLERLLGMLAIEQRVLALHGGKGMNLVRSPNHFGLGLAEAKSAHLARLHQFSHSADRVLDRHQ